MPEKKRYDELSGELAEGVAQSERAQPGNAEATLPVSEPLRVREIVKSAATMDVRDDSTATAPNNRAHRQVMLYDRNGLYRDSLQSDSIRERKYSTSSFGH